MDAVGRTSVGVAAMRATESTRPDRWFDDPYAQRFLDALSWDGAVPDPEATDDPMWRAIICSVIARTRFLDEILGSVATPQVVILGAGLDSRAYRLDWAPGTRLWELDQHEVLAFKDDVLADESPSCERRTVAVDLRDDWPAALEAAGHDADQPTTWVAEGLLMYFDDAGVDQLLARLTDRSPAGSRLAITTKVATPGAPTGMTPLWRSFHPDDPVAWMAERGWTATSADWRDLAAAWGRPDWQAIMTTGLVDAVRTLEP